MQVYCTGWSVWEYILWNRIKEKKHCLMKCKIKQPQDSSAAQSQRGEQYSRNGKYTEKKKTAPQKNITWINLSTFAQHGEEHRFWQQGKVSEGNPCTLDQKIVMQERTLWHPKQILWGEYCPGRFPSAIILRWRNDSLEECADSILIQCITAEVNGTFSGETRDEVTEIMRKAADGGQHGTYSDMCHTQSMAC